MAENCTSVFILQHVHESDEGGEDVKLIGVYTSRDLAEQALSRVRSQPGFDDAQDGFCVSRYELNQDHWTEGYVTVATLPSEP